jgi:hypothetical protein
VKPDGSASIHEYGLWMDEFKGTKRSRLLDFKERFPGSYNINLAFNQNSLSMDVQLKEIMTECCYISVAILFICNLRAKQNSQVKEDEMGRAYSTNGGEEECI